MLLGESLPEAVRLGVDDEVDVTLAVQGDVLAAVTRDGGMFRDGYYAPLDELRRASTEGKQWIAQLQQRAIDETGIVKPETLEAALTDDTAVVSVIHSNNEIGTIQPIAEIGKVAKEKNVFFHCDATQGFAKLPIALAT